MPQAWTLIRTDPGPGSGIGRSTISNGPPAFGICATRIVAIVASFAEASRFARLPGWRAARSDQRRRRAAPAVAELAIRARVTYRRRTPPAVRAEARNSLEARERCRTEIPPRSDPWRSAIGGPTGCAA